ncbi:MAG TPA: hypothetical protein VLE19_15540, partial [Pyrinomonadaceae bacterium]|nr:hypothetical protein [Pyrinomonadaceae bacterium]
VPVCHTSNVPVHTEYFLKHYDAGTEATGWKGQVSIELLPIKRVDCHHRKWIVERKVGMVNAVDGIIFLLSLEAFPLAVETWLSVTRLLDSRRMSTATQSSLLCSRLDTRLSVCNNSVN